MPNFGQYSLSLFMEDKDMYTWESQQLLYCVTYGWATYNQLPHDLVRLSALHSTTGKQIWQKEITVQPPSSAWALHHDVLYFVNYFGSVVAIDMKTGHVRWHYDKGKENPYVRIAVCGDIIGLALSDWTLRALHAASGQLLWTLQDDYGLLRLKVTGKAIYVVAREGKQSISFPHCALALDLQTGTVLWKKHLPVTNLQYGFITATDTMVYVAYPDYTQNRSGVVMLYALDSRHGSEIWTMQLSGNRVFSASVIEDILYLTVIPNLLAFDAHTGELLWSYEYEPLQKQKPDRIITLLASQDRVFTLQESVAKERSSEHWNNEQCLYRLCAIDRATKKLLWSVREDGTDAVAVTSARQEAICFSLFRPTLPAETRLFAISKQDGRELWSTPGDDGQFITCTEVERLYGMYFPYLYHMDS
jgi:outer membrane protein assembly factor BamB